MELRRKGGGDGRFRACRGLAALPIALEERTDTSRRVESVVAAAGLAGHSCGRDRFVRMR
jgi:hypothetical protein